MDNYTATELAYKNGYERGKKDAVVHGRWLDNGIPESVLSRCSECGIMYGSSAFNYCPNCGAKMDGGETNA